MTLRPNRNAVIDRFTRKDWRLSNLYYIKDKTGRKTLFKPNWAQLELLADPHPCKIILKARQIGITTFFAIYLLDECLYNPNITAGIIAHTLDDSQSIFEDKVKFAYDSLDPMLKGAFPLVSDSAKELAFAHGSRIRVGTSMRGQSLQYLHISEFGKICAKYPEKAKEIVTGSLNSVQAGQHIFIESTAEGTGGYFYDMCQLAQKQARDKLYLTPLDYKFFFFPWWRDPSYTLSRGDYMEPESTLQADIKQHAHIDLKNNILLDYFKELEAYDIHLSGPQKSWYMGKYAIQEEDMKREYPSTPEESFQSSASGLYYGKHLTQARLDKRMTNVPYDDSMLVHTAWDLGRDDNNAIWFFQCSPGGEIRLIDFHQDTGRSLAEYIKFLKAKPYDYGTHLAPHDIKVKEYSSGFSRQAFAADLGIILTDVPKLKVQEGIDAVRSMFSRCWFDKTRCAVGIQMLDNYRKTWDVKLARWSDEPHHDYASDAADAFRTLAVGLPLISGQKSDLSDTYKAINSYFR